MRTQLFDTFQPVAARPNSPPKRCESKSVNSLLMFIYQRCGEKLNFSLVDTSFNIEFEHLLVRRNTRVKHEVEDKARYLLFHTDFP